MHVRAADAALVAALSACGQPLCSYGCRLFVVVACLVAAVLGVPAILMLCLAAVLHVMLFSVTLASAFEYAGNLQGLDALIVFQG